MKEIIESKRPEDYFFETMMKKGNGKRLSQKERIFAELYANESVPCYFFTLQMKPACLQYNARIFALRKQGFIIECEWHIKDGVKHSEYKLNKVHFEVEA